MRTQLYWIECSGPGRLAILPRPRGGDWLEDEVANWRREQVQVVASLLTPDESRELGLSDEAQLCQAAGITFVSFPVADRGVPASKTALAGIARQLAGLLEQGQTVGVHCRQGIGRSALLAAAVLSATGIPADAALERIAAGRGAPVPDTAEQRDWILRFAKDQLVPVPR